MVFPLSKTWNYKIIDEVVIYKQEGKYSCFPELFRLNNDTFVVTFGVRNTSSHYDPSGSSKQMISIDGGKYWTETATKHYDNELKNNFGNYIKVSQNGWKGIEKSAVTSIVR